MKTGNEIHSKGKRRRKGRPPSAAYSPTTLPPEQRADFVQFALSPRNYRAAEIAQAFVDRGYPMAVGSVRKAIHRIRATAGLSTRPSGRPCKYSEPDSHADSGEITVAVTCRDRDTAARIAAAIAEVLGDIGGPH